MKTIYFIISLLLSLFLVSTSNAQVIWPEYVSAYPADQTYAITGHHRDVLGKMFPAFGTGTLDTFFFQVGNVSSVSPQAKIRIFQAKVGPHTGPGFGSYAGGCQNWGYYVNAGDPDQGITPFKEAATDTHWISTIGGATPSFSPLGNELWGLGGYLVTLVPNTINKVALSDLGSPLSITAGDSIFVTMEIVHSGGHVDDPPNEFDATWVDQGIAPKEESESLVPTGIWKFYEHNVGTSFGNVPPIKGWRYITGGADTIDSPRPPKPFLRWWFLFHPTANVMPKIKTLSRVYNTLSTGSQIVQSEMFDLNGTNPSAAGVKNAWVKFAREIPTDTHRVSMSYTGSNNIWQGTIPGQSQESMISYWIEAVDSQGLFARSLPVTYQVLNMQTDYYSIDTTSIPFGPGRVETPIPHSSFFRPTDPLEDQPSATDNGTAGPIDLGGPFVFFGKTVRYAWIGVDGAIALTASPTDTQHINMNGFFGALWDIPGRSVRGDTGLSMPAIPKNFIAPLYMDMKLDSTNIGHIYYGNGGDTNQFIIQWDSMEVSQNEPIFSKALPIVHPMSILQRVSTTFRAILNRKEGSVEFQYGDVAIDINMWFRSRVGMQGEIPTPLQERNWSSVNKSGYPVELKPRTGRSIKMNPVGFSSVSSGWNLMSIPVSDVLQRKSVLYPTATSSAFEYHGSYVAKDTLKPRTGFWLKFGGKQALQIPGSSIDSLTIPVTSGWNIIGSISAAIPVASITSSPPGIVTSSFFGYNPGAGYQVASAIVPGYGYWVKTNQSGFLKLSSLASAKALNRITIVPTDEMPPPPPGEISAVPGLPREYALEQSYPNPFNPTSTIRYALPADAHVTLKIYNTLGQVVSVLINEVQDAGYKSAVWNARSVASGVYFYRLEATGTGNARQSFTQVKKMVLLK